MLLRASPKQGVCGGVKGGRPSPGRSRSSLRLQLSHPGELRGSGGSSPGSGAAAAAAVPGSDQRPSCDRGAWQERSQVEVKAKPPDSISRGQELSPGVILSLSPSASLLAAEPGDGRVLPSHCSQCPCEVSKGGTMPLPWDHPMAPAEDKVRDIRGQGDAGGNCGTAQRGTSHRALRVQSAQL